MGPEKVEETVEEIEKPAEDFKEPIEYIEEPFEDIEESIENIEEPIKDVEELTENIEYRASAAGEQPMEENNEGFSNGRQEGRGENSLSTLGFPIGDLRRGATPMNNIPLSALPNFHGLSSKDPDEFPFDFDILCRSYDYVTNDHKLKLFLETLKGNALRWFMNLAGHVIMTW